MLSYHYTLIRISPKSLRILVSLFSARLKFRYIWWTALGFSLDKAVDIFISQLSVAMQDRSRSLKHNAPAEYRLYPYPPQWALHLLTSAYISYRGSSWWS